jgi:hypothetical protein
MKDRTAYILFGLAALAWFVRSRNPKGKPTTDPNAAYRGRIPYGE